MALVCPHCHKPLMDKVKGRADVMLMRVADMAGQKYLNAQEMDVVRPFVESFLERHFGPEPVQSLQPKRRKRVRK